jgi:hypothetical protein
MIWGLGGEEREIGYGSWRTSRMMTSEAFNETLEATSSLL